MSADPGADSQARMQTESVVAGDPCPAKALFRGEIINSAFWPFPEIDTQQRELLEMVVESVDRFLADQQDNFGDWDRRGSQAER